MNLEITKTDFERAVPAAREPKGKIFDVMQDAIMCKVRVIADSILGEPGIAAVEDIGNPLYDYLRSVVKRLACVSAFLEEMRGLDLVLTATGFGVVSSNDTVPASKMRVDALEGELRRKEQLLRSQLAHELFRVGGWSDTNQRRSMVETLFYHFDMLKQLTSNSLSESNYPVAVLCQKYIGAWIAQNQQLKEELYMRLINRLEADLSFYPKYADSEAYRLNHFEPYENHAEDSAFHFVG